jgi:hypothetical protein
VLRLGASSPKNLDGYRPPRVFQKTLIMLTPNPEIDRPKRLEWMPYQK